MRIAWHGCHCGGETTASCAEVSAPTLRLGIYPQAYKYSTNTLPSTPTTKNIRSKLPKYKKLFFKTLPRTKYSSLTSTLPICAMGGNVFVVIVASCLPYWLSLCRGEKLPIDASYSCFRPPRHALVLLSFTLCFPLTKTFYSLHCIIFQYCECLF